MFDRERITSLNAVIKDRNDLSSLNSFASNELSQDDISCLNDLGITDKEGQLVENVQSAMDILANPYTVLKVNFTGGAGTYVHTVSYDKTLENYVSLTSTPDIVSIEDEANPVTILKTLEEFIGNNSLKSAEVSIKLSINEALVVAAMIDMEKKYILRAFVDELPFNHNSYNATLIWRMINSTSSNIQWLVYIINSITGDTFNISQKQVQEALDQLMNKGAVIKGGLLYQLSNELSILSNRMIIVDNILSIQISKKAEDSHVISTGFTCVQSGVHDLLFLDYNGTDIIFESISSADLMERISQMLNCKEYFEKL
jgi:hypothetical protein